MHRFKFGSESLLITPFVGAVGKSAKALAQKGKELAYSSNRFERYLNKFAEAFTPEGPLTRAVFGSQKVMEGFRAKDLNRATELVKQLDRTVSKAFPEMQKVLDKSITKAEKDEFYKGINELILDGDLTKMVNPKTLDKFVANIRKNYTVTDKADGERKLLYISENYSDASKAVDEIFNGKFGKAENLLIEEFLNGEEMSFFTIHDGNIFKKFETAQDHKRVLAGD